MSKMSNMVELLDALEGIDKDCKRVKEFLSDLDDSIRDAEHLLSEESMALLEDRVETVEQELEMLECTINDMGLMAKADYNEMMSQIDASEDISKKVD